jgi:Zn-dependent protease
VFDAAPTPLDWHFRLLGFSVRVSPWFWLTALFLGWDLRDLGGWAVLMWIGCMFVSILLHELGHALAYRFYGIRAVDVVLHGFGGYAQADRRPASRWRRIAVSLAGPGIQFALLGLLVVSDRSTGWRLTNEYTIVLYGLLYSINLWWPLFNLLPIWPLDGGQVTRELFFLAKVPRAEVQSLKLSLATALLLAIASVLMEFGKLPPEVAEWIPFRFGFFGIVFMFLFAFQSYQLLQMANRAYDWDDGPYDDAGRWRP